MLCLAMKSQELANCENSCNGKKEVEEASPVERKVKAGDIIWVKNRGALWWPAQVDEITAGKRSARKVLVRQYGTYTYSYVDPDKWRSEFETMLEQNNGSYREIFAKSLKQDVARLKNGGSRKRNSKPEGNKEDKSRQSKKSTTPKMKSKPNEGDQDAAKKKSKQKEKRKTREGDKSNEDDLNDSSPAREKMPCSRTQELSARRIRVMQSLGLAAPTGSPFTRNARLRVST